jgi:hypothetical protein
MPVVTILSSIHARHARRRIASQMLITALGHLITALGLSNLIVAAADACSTTRTPVPAVLKLIARMRRITAKAKSKAPTVWRDTIAAAVASRIACSCKRFVADYWRECQQMSYAMPTACIFGLYAVVLKQRNLENIYI